MGSDVCVVAGVFMWVPFIGYLANPRWHARHSLIHNFWSYLFGAHLLMENRHGLCVQFKLASATDTKEPEAALEMVDQQDEIHDHQAVSLGADKNYHTKAFVSGCRERGIKPHVAPIKNRQTPGMDGRTINSRGYQTSQRIRKRIEEIIGWMKTVGGFRKTRYRGIARTQQSGWFIAAAYNLVRMAKLGAGPPMEAAPV